MRYQGMVYRPPSEADSLIIQATIGCPHNKCTFCSMYRKSRFRIRPVEEILEDLNMGRDYYGPGLKRIFFGDGNTILMKTPDLVRILEYAYEIFPELESLTMYGSAQYIILKSQDELEQISRAGLTRIHSGMESGDDQVLRFAHKGFTREEMIRSAKMVKAAGIEQSLYYIVGLGGRDLSKSHAIHSASLINQVNPDYIRLRTIMPVAGTPLFTLYQEGKFHLPSPYEAIQETRLLVQSLEGIDSYFLNDHVSNHTMAHGKLPEDKERILKELDYDLTRDESDFRRPDHTIL